MHTIKITPNLLFEYQCTSGKFIRLPNRKNRFGSENRIKTFLPELECSSLHKCRQIRTNSNTLRVTDTSKQRASQQSSDVSLDTRGRIYKTRYKIILSLSQDRLITVTYSVLSHFIEYRKLVYEQHLRRSYNFASES